MADRYHNPDPLIRLIGPVNESTVILEGKEYPTLLDSGAQPSGISLKLARKLGLKIYQLDTLLDMEGGEGSGASAARRVLTCLFIWTQSFSCEC